MSGRRHPARMPGQPLPRPSRGRGELRTSLGRAARLSRWLEQQPPGAVPPILVAVNHGYTEGRAVVCPPLTDSSDLATIVPTAASIVVELDRLGAILFGFDAWVSDPRGELEDGAALWCVDVVRGSVPMIALIPYQVVDGRNVTARPDFEPATRNPQSAQIAAALSLAWDVAHQPEQGPVVRAWLAEHGYGADSFTV